MDNKLKNIEKTLTKLDLNDYIQSLKTLFSREKELFIEGDIKLHFNLINELSNIDFTPPPKIENLKIELASLSKQGVLKLNDIFEFIKIIKYFNYLKKVKFENRVLKWLEKIIIPNDILELINYFNKDGEIKENIYQELDQINLSIKKNREVIKTALHRLMNNQKLSSYLVDRSIHYFNGEETILVRGGFNHIIKGKVIGRSSSGFFYIIPSTLTTLKDKEDNFIAHKEEILYKIAKELSLSLQKHLLFLKFIDKEFDKFDHYQARVFFAKFNDLNFILPNSNHNIIIKDYSHPALKNPKPINIDFTASILMITGVNAGGKTMMLKSILSTVFLAKYLIPMKISKKSKIGSFKSIKAILDDPQNVKNDISTFAGRMVEFSKIFREKSLILGVDEIELGTDSDEAATLFKVVLEELVKRDIKIIITTHHKRLASLLSSRDDVELVAAIYDEKNQRPTYDFLQGTIGKSYAFETAQRYGIPANIIKNAKIVYGEDRDRLNELIERSSSLERELKSKISKLDNEIEIVHKKRLALDEDREQLNQDIKLKIENLEKEYRESINIAKKAAKENDKTSIHKLMNKADKKLKQSQINKNIQKIEKIDFKKGDRVKYRNIKGFIISLKSKEAYIETDDGMKLRVNRNELKRSGNPIKIKPKIIKATVQQPKSLSIKLDLHGLRAMEAEEQLDRFISDSLLAGFDELLVYHGIGTGKLSYAVKEFLKKHPSVKGFEDAPPNMGGFGAKIIYL